MKTNDTIINQLRKYEEKGLIQIQIIKEPIQKKQLLARLDFIGITTILFNLTNKDFWIYIKNPIGVGEYSIKII